MRPVGTFESGVSPSAWREVSVMGNMLKLREQRSSRNPGDEVSIVVSKCQTVHDLAIIMLGMSVHKH